MSRRRKTNQDRISECPDSVLVHILSFLDIEDAVRTQVLSKRWQFLWTFLPSLVFRYAAWDDWDAFDCDGIDCDGIDCDGDDFRLRRNSDFVTFIDKTLFSSDCRLKKFEVSIEHHASFASKVDSWTRFAAEKGVEELCLQLCHNGPEYKLPQLLYDNSWFKELRFSGCRVIPEGNIAWYSLKKLSIGQVTCSNDVIEGILAGSPVLEILELHDIGGFSRITITNSCVKKLILMNFQYSSPDSDSGLEITAPYILSLEMSGCLGNVCRLTNVSSLVDAVFNCNFQSYFADIDDGYERIFNIVQIFLQSLSHVKNLTLGTWALQVLSIMEAKGLSSPLMNCKCLILDTRVDKYVLGGISNVFKSTPNVEALIMTFSIYQSGLLGIESVTLLNCNEEQYWTSQEWSYKCLFLTLHLKNVTISDRLVKYQYILFKKKYQYHCADSNFFSFLQFLLRSARVLQRMVISTPTDAPLKECFESAKKVLSFPRSSPDAAVIFC